MTTLVCAAHSDDEVIGCGGTIAKLAKKEKVIVLIFSYGSGEAGSITSWPLFMSPEKLKKKRMYESERASHILGVDKTIFLGIDSEIESGFNIDKKKKLLEIIEEYKPDKLFYHSSKDAHVDHHAVNEIMEEIIPKLDYKPEIYTYQVNMFDFGSTNPKIIFDVSKEFNLKIKALLTFKSQFLSIFLLSPLIFLKGYIHGKKHGFKFAEYFYGR